MSGGHGRGWSGAWCRAAGEEEHGVEGFRRQPRERSPRLRSMEHPAHSRGG
jgi:hypothetical protein